MLETAHPLIPLAADPRRLPHPNLQRPYSPTDILVVLASTAGHRFDAVVEAAGAIGISRRPITTNGVAIETGATPGHCAVEKVDAVARRLQFDGYFDRNPDRLTLFVGVDALNTQGMTYFGKPQNVDMFTSYGVLWERATMGETEIYSESAYELLASCRGKVQRYSLNDRVRLQPKSREIVQRVFYPPEERMADSAHIAHGFPTIWGIEHGELFAFDHLGYSLVGQEAVDRTIGASAGHLTSLFAQALTDFSSYI